LVNLEKKIDGEMGLVKHTQHSESCQCNAIILTNTSICIDKFQSCVVKFYCFHVLKYLRNWIVWGKTVRKNVHFKVKYACPDYKISKDRFTLPLGENERANKKAWINTTLFGDLIVKCGAIPELKVYSATQKLDLNVLTLLDNAPGYPVGDRRVYVTANNFS
jgi:hypothetical protein